MDRLEDEREVRGLYTRLLDSWNQRSPQNYAALFMEDGGVVGFDGSQMQGPGAIQAAISQIFRDHVTAPYVSKIKTVRFLSADVAQLHAIAGMIPPGQTELNPAVNTIQTLTAVREGVGWRIAFYQNTPAQFHGRPELVREMTAELRELL